MPAWQVRAVVTAPPTVQVPVQVMVQFPALQLTLLPAPTVCVHVLPLHCTLAAGPAVPVQIAFASHLKSQLEVEAEQALNAQV